MRTNEAKPVKLPGGRRAIRPEPGPCLWCGEYVESDRETTGATSPHDASWTVPGSGDFGCDASPWTGEEGTGDHARPYDLAVATMRLSRAAEEAAPTLHENDKMEYLGGIDPREGGR